jgi:hypothetical protein
MYQSVSWDYLKFLVEENKTDSWGRPTLRRAGGYGDSGQTWIPTSAPIQVYRFVASSAEGSRLLAAGPF